MNKKKTKKIVYIVNAKIPSEKAHGIQMMKMCEAFSDIGSEVLFIVPWRFNCIRKNPFEYWEIKKNFKIKRFPCLDLIPLDFILGSWALWIQKSSFLTLVKIYLLFKNYDILYTREQFTGLFFKNFVLEIHSLPKKIKKIHKKIWKKANKIVVVTDFMKKELEKIGVLGNKVSVEPDGVDMEIFDLDINKKNAVEKLILAKKIRNKLLNNTVLVYTGNFKTWGADKGIKEILKALNKLNNDKLYFIAVGGKEEDVKYYKKLAKDLQVENRAEFLGRKKQKELALFQKAGGIMLMPFPDKVHYRYFMSPLKMFEYMTSKRPIIASDLPSIREILDKNNAILVKPNGTETLAKSINFALKNPDFCAKISKQAYKDVQKYTWDKRAKRIINFLDNRE